MFPCFFTYFFQKMLRLRCINQHKQIIHNTYRCVSIKATSKTADKGGNDSRNQLITNALYSPQPSPPLPTSISTEQHELIERMWALEKWKEAELYSNQLKAQYESMRKAMCALRASDPFLFEGACKKDVDADGRDKIVSFPKRFRVPTETPPLNGWSYELI